MFERIKKALSRQAQEPRESLAPSSQLAHGAASEWAATQGFGFHVDKRHTMSLDGKVGGKAWKLQVGNPSRAYIRGEELRARAELGVHDDVAILVMNRKLKEALEKQAYEMYTDDLQTSADPRLPEEMRWLAMFDEVGWEGLSQPFWSRYAVLTDNKAYALEWVAPELVDMMLGWPQPAPGPQVPMLILLLRGKAYLRMEYTPADMPTLQHASKIFQKACEVALRALPPQPK